MKKNILCGLLLLATLLSADEVEKTSETLSKHPFEKELTYQKLLQSSYDALKKTEIHYLHEAELLTGLETEQYRNKMSFENTERLDFSFVAKVSLKGRDTNCIAFGAIHNGVLYNAKDIKFYMMRCDDGKKYDINGRFFNDDKILGAKGQYYKEKDTLLIPPQKGYIAFSDKNILSDNN